LTVGGCSEGDRGASKGFPLNEMKRVARVETYLLLTYNRKRLIEHKISFVVQTDGVKIDSGVKKEIGRSYGAIFRKEMVPVDMRTVTLYILP
jgi:hypothetical protein